MPTKTVTCAIVDRANMIHRRSRNYYKWVRLTGVTPSDCSAVTDVCLQNVSRFRKRKHIHEGRTNERSFRYCQVTSKRAFISVSCEIQWENQRSTSPPPQLLSRQFAGTRGKPTICSNIANIEQHDKCIWSHNSCVICTTHVHTSMCVRLVK